VAGPQPLEVLAALRALEWPLFWLRGNADRAVVMGHDGTIPPELADHPLFVGDAWTGPLLSRADRDFLDTLPPLVTLTVEGLGEVLFVHGTARSDEERVTVFTPPARVEALLAYAGLPLVVGGHTHRQFDHVVAGGRFVNAGSVGRPYELQPGAYWARLGPDVRLLRTEYDVEAAMEAFRATGFPGVDEIWGPVDADEVATRYEAESGKPLRPASLIPPSALPVPS
jgi:predicted phosphodiesterase